MKHSGRIAARDQSSNQVTLPEIGRIKIGMKAKSASGAEYPKSLDYFIATGPFAQTLHQAVGAQPKFLTIAFISDDVSQVCNERMESWCKGKRYGYGDGVNFTIWENGKYVDVCLYDADGNKDQKVKQRLSAINKIGEWKVTLTLKFIVLELRNIIGHWTLETKASKTSIPMIVGAFDLVKEKSSTIIGFPFTLMVEKVTGRSPGEPRSYSIIKLVPNFSEETMQAVRDYISAGHNPNLLSANTTLLLTNGNNNNLQK